MATSARVLWISGTGARTHEIEDIPALLRRKQGFVWLDLPSLDEDGVRLLEDTFKFDRPTVQQARELSLVPRLRRGKDHLFLSLHSLDPDRHLIEIGQFIGRQFLVTTHVVRDPSIPKEAILREATQVWDRIQEGGFRPRSSVELASTLVAGIARRLEEYLGDIAASAGALDRRMREGRTGRQQDFLEEVYEVRHELITVRNRAAQNRAACARTAEVVGELVPGLAAPFEEVAVRLERLASLCDGEREFLQDLLDFYEHVLTANMNIAMERLALIVVLLAPTTIATGIYGMNVALPGQGDPAAVVWVLGAVFAASAALAAWARRQGWL